MQKQQDEWLRSRNVEEAEMLRRQNEMLQNLAARSNDMESQVSAAREDAHAANAAKGIAETQQIKMQAEFSGVLQQERQTAAQMLAQHQQYSQQVADAVQQ